MSYRLEDEGMIRHAEETLPKLIPKTIANSSLESLHGEGRKSRSSLMKKTQKRGKTYRCKENER